MPQPGASRLDRQVCLVVGASGFVGQQLCRDLTAQGARVRALLRRPLEGPWHEQVVVDLLDFQLQQQALFEGVDCIFYLASIAHNKAPKSQYQSFNVDLCLRFARIAMQSGVQRFIYVSSAKAVAQPGSEMVNECFDEWPEDEYGQSKRRAEEGLLLMRDGFAHLAILRPCLIYGAGVEGNLQMMMRWIDKGLFPPLPATPHRRSMVSVADVSSALCQLAVADQAHGHVYFLTDGQQYSPQQIERSIRAAFGKKMHRWSVPIFAFGFLAATGDLFKKFFGRFPITSAEINKVMESALYDSSNFCQHCGWSPSHTFDDVLPDMVSAYRKIKGNRA